MSELKYSTASHEMDGLLTGLQ